MPSPPENFKRIEDLLKIVADLRGPEGCPWDLEQTAKTLSPFVIEEAYELVEVLDQGPSYLASESGAQKLKEELGDVLFQVILQSQLAQEAGLFNFMEVSEHLARKLVRRHPHVFSDTPAQSIEEVWTQWEKIKTQEKKESKSVLNFFDIPQHLPSLQRAYKIGVKTQKKKFDWYNPKQVLEKVDEELAELKVEINNLEKQSLNQTQNPQSDYQKRIEEELGDLLFSVAQLARHLNFEPEQALRSANKKFETRFQQMLKLADDKKMTWETLSDNEKENLWNEVKALSSKP